MKITTIGIDLAKNVFQVHGVDDHGNAVFRKKLDRVKMVAVGTAVTRRPSAQIRTCGTTNLVNKPELINQQDHLLLPAATANRTLQPMRSGYGLNDGAIPRSTRCPPSGSIFVAISLAVRQMPPLVKRVGEHDRA